MSGYVFTMLYITITHPLSSLNSIRRQNPNPKTQGGEEIILPHSQGRALKICSTHKTKSLRNLMDKLTNKKSERGMQVHNSKTSSSLIRISNHSQQKKPMPNPSSAKKTKTTFLSSSKVTTCASWKQKKRVLMLSLELWCSHENHCRWKGKLLTNLYDIV